MTIKDIARAANVSTATVSRIINQKDDNISQETRDRVLRIIQENNYVPYAKIRDRILSQTRSIGMVIPTLLSTFYVQFASEMQQLARENNYSLVMALASGNSRDEISTLNDFSQNHTDGVLIFSGTEEGIARLSELHSEGMAAIVMSHYRNVTTLPQLYRDSEEIARQCTQQLLDNNCTQIGLVLRPTSSQALHNAIISGYLTALSAAGLPFQRNYITYSDGNFAENFRSMADTGLTGLVCQYVDAAQVVYATAASDGIRIPGDISVISMEDAPDVSTLTPPLTAARTDVKSMARQAFECLLSQIEHTTMSFSTQKVECPIQNRGSVQFRMEHRSKILVAGFINTDTLLHTPDLPQYGKTQVSSFAADYVGGKGANQAYGISRLGGNTGLLGCLGSDRRGRSIYDHLSRSGIRLEGVSFLNDQPTGTAYISLYPGGKSSVLINPGANTALDAAYIRRHAHLLKDAAYCLAQTDMTVEAVLQLCKLCAEYQVPMVLHASYGRQIPPELCSGLHMLILKDQDRAILCPQLETAEDAVRHFLDLGAEHVLILSNVSACLWGSREGLRRYPAYNYPRTDETGASDVFIACLVTLLSEGTAMDSAIRAACWAAAYGATCLGVQNGFPDRKMLDKVASGVIALEFPGMPEV